MSDEKPVYWKIKTMNANTDHKSICSVSTMAAKLGLSRARFYQLQTAGIFPVPVYCIRTKRPFYPENLQAICLKIRTTGIGLNGHPVLFYSKSNNTRISPKDNSADNCKEIAGALEELGLKVSPMKIKSAVKSLFPTEWQHLTVDGELIAKLFRHFRSGV